MNINSPHLRVSQAAAPGPWGSPPLGGTLASPHAQAGLHAAAELPTDLIALSLDLAVASEVPTSLSKRHRAMGIAALALTAVSGSLSLASHAAAAMPAFEPAS